jgi:transcriptional regulator with XRE-family HTH domain
MQNQQRGWFMKKPYNPKGRPPGEKSKRHPLAMNVRLRRARLGLSNAAVAEIIGIDQQWLQKMQNGHFKFIDPDVLIRLAIALGTTPDGLLGVGQDAEMRAV